jgi:toxin ParE1/3/4
LFTWAKKPDSKWPRSYFVAVEATCTRLVAHPRSGKVYDSGIKKLPGLRYVPVKTFDDYLLFYMARADSIDVIRVLHGARNIKSILGHEEV